MAPCDGHHKVRRPSPIQDMTETTPGVRIRPLDELDISDIVAIDEKISGRYRPEVWERQIRSYRALCPSPSRRAEMCCRLSGFIRASLRSGKSASALAARSR